MGKKETIASPLHGRYAPSPTGILHLGNLRTALLAWAFSRNSNGKFILRVEDLDRGRVRPEYITQQLKDLETLGLDWDGPVWYQSQRLDYYRSEFTRLAQTHQLYQCYCSRKEIAQAASAPHLPPGIYPGTCRQRLANQDALAQAKQHWQGAHAHQPDHQPVWRLALPEQLFSPTKNPGDQIPVTETTFIDRLYGRQTHPVDDLLLTRSDGVYAYNFVSVVDDAAAGVNFICRGRDLLPTTPRQIFLAQQLGYNIPIYHHVPMVLNEAGIRLAKRDGAITLPALANYGWEVGDIIELLSLSLGLSPARSGVEFRTALQAVPSLPTTDTVFPVNQFPQGPEAILSSKRNSFSFMPAGPE